MQDFHTVYGVSPPTVHFYACGEESDWEQSAELGIGKSYHGPFI